MYWKVRSTILMGRSARKKQQSYSFPWGRKELYSDFLEPMPYGYYRNLKKKCNRKIS